MNWNPRLWVLSCFLLSFFLITGSALGTTQGGTDAFATPRGLETQVEFWKKVYTEYTTRHAILHDSNDLNIIYEVVYLGEKRLSHRARQRRVDPIRRKYKKILQRLAKRKGTLGLSSEERRVANLVKGSYTRASNNIRVQLGQKDRFREGLRRSGLYMDGIRQVFKEQGLPEELTVLPHVESSFQVNAYSSAGAAGVWQFTRRTGRRFMKIGYDVDERLDPILSAYAAAKLLKFNYDELKSWPMAITAYNHGLNGMKRAKRKHGTNFVKIVRHYKSRTFGFASRNFYAEFLAALDVVKNHKKHFPKVIMERPIKTVSTRLSHYIHINDMIRHLGISRDEIAEYNPALREPVISGKKRIPKNFIFKAPTVKYAGLNKQLAMIPEKRKFSRQIRSKWYTVRSGDTLSAIARRMGTTIRALKVANHIDNQHRIYRGQVLEMPWIPAGTQKPLSRIARSHVQRDYGTDELQNYRVRRYDNLSKIARRFGMNVRDLVSVNRLRHPDRLQPGQLLKVAMPAVVARVDEKKIKKESLKPALKVDQPRIAKVEEEVVAVSVEEPAGKGKIKIEYSDTISHSQHFNKNRPAFLPVQFEGTHKNGKVGLIAVDFEETLSHYADWSGLSLRELRRFNRLHRKASLKINQTVKIPLYKATAEEFASRRQEYHKAIQEDFFNHFHVEKVVIRNLKKGETLWEIVNDIDVVPMWLLSNYNPEKNLDSIHAGEPIVIPVITANKA